MKHLDKKFAQAWSARQRKAKQVTVFRNLSTPEGRAFWHLSKRAKEAAKWPAWKHAGINV